MSSKILSTSDKLKASKDEKKTTSPAAAAATEAKPVAFKPYSDDKVELLIQLRHFIIIMV